LLGDALERWGCLHRLVVVGAHGNERRNGGAVGAQQRAQECEECLRLLRAIGEEQLLAVEAAHNGTLFLDEVADMPLETQGKIVRVLQEQIFERVGGSTRVEVDVRVVAASTQDLAGEISAGRFREDLFYRLNVVPFHVPALRERAEDIPLLADYFLEQFASAYGRRKKELAPDALEVLQSYPWPGNVRELKNMIERLVIMAPQDRIRKSHLPPELSRGRGRAPAMAATLEEARTNSDRQFIQRKLEENRWNVTRTAAAIGVERSHLHRKMRALGISPQRNT